MTDLKPSTQTWFTALCKTYALEEPFQRLLKAAGASWDRAEEARLVIDQHGLTFVDSRGNPRPRPEVAIERNSRIAFARLLREVSLALDAREELSRPRKFVTINGRRQKAPGA